MQCNACVLPTFHSRQAFLLCHSRLLLLSCVVSVGVILFNHSDTDFHVKTGDRVAQLILERIAIAEVQEVDDLDRT